MTKDNITIENLLNQRSFYFFHTIFFGSKKQGLSIELQKGEPNWALYDFENIQNFPSITWKLKNIKTMSSSKGKNAHENLEKLSLNFKKQENMP